MGKHVLCDVSSVLGFLCWVALCKVSCCVGLWYGVVGVVFRCGCVSL